MLSGFESLPPSQPSLGFAELRLGRHASRGDVLTKRASDRRRLSRRSGVTAKADLLTTAHHLLSDGRMHSIGRRFVYILRSEIDPSRHYVGITTDFKERLRWHNEGLSGYTVSKGPWLPVVVLEFPSERGANRFEGYLKSGSGRAFAKRHFGD